MISLIHSPYKSNYIIFSVVYLTCMKQKFMKLKSNILNSADPLLYFSRRINKHSVAAHAAQSTLFIFISFFPFVMLFLTLLNYIPLPLTEGGSLQPGLLPVQVTNFINTILKEIHSTASGTVISLTAVTALWSSSKGFYAVGKGLNSVYEVKETRNYFILRFYALLQTIAFIFVLIIVLVILVFGNIIHLWLNNVSPLLAKIIDIIISLRGIGGLTLLSVFFTLVYVITPDRKTKFSKQLPGGILTAVGWIIFSYFYSLYIDNFAMTSNVYGSLTSIVLLMLWLYFCIYILFLGGEINNIIECYQKKLFHHKFHKG